MSFLQSIVNTTCQLAPWLLLGMLLSGILHVALPKGFIRRRFRGKRGIISSVALGVPLPLCSCGVVPAGIGLKNDGASDGASVGFLISTPQTGVDSVLVSASFFGWPFAIFKMVAAMITGVVGGLLADQSSHDSALATDETAPKNHSHSSANHWLLELIGHGIEIVRSIWIWLVIGILISAGIEYGLPTSWMEALGSIGLLPAMLIVLAISVPLYVCATASVPIAAALVLAGMPPAAAMVFLMAGPATNTTTIGAIYGRFGWRVLIVYLATLIVGSMASAFLFDWLLQADPIKETTHLHHHTNLISSLSAGILAVMFLWFTYESVQSRLQRRKRDSANLQSAMVFQVDGMHCTSCAQRLQKSLAQLPNIESAEVDFQAKQAIINGAVDPALIEQAITDSGLSLIK